MATYPCKPGETCKKKVQSIYLLLTLKSHFMLITTPKYREYDHEYLQKI